MTVKIRIIPALIAVLLLAGCGDPKQVAQSQIQNVHEALANAGKNLDPLDRLALYDKLLDQVKAVGKNYGQTPTGRAIAAGNSIDGVSISRVQGLRDALAPRAKCYADPTVECLTPFGSGAERGGNSQAQNAFAQSEALICASGFRAADQSLASFKINQSVYAKQLVQLALAAAACHKPYEVKAAIGAYMAAVPAGSSERPDGLLSILATPDLQPAWPMVSGELEKGLQSGALTGQNAGNAALALTMAYARTGNVNAALAKYAYFTDTLHYHANGETVRKLAAAVMVAGDADAAMKVGATGDASTDGFFVTRAAANLLGQRMGLIDDLGRPDGIIQSLNSNTMEAATIKDYLKPITGPAKTADENAADAIESQADKLAASPKGTFTGSWGLDGVYGIVAIARYALGQPDKAAVALKKGQALRVRVLGAGAATSNSDNFIAFSVLAQLAQNDVMTAARLAKAGGLDNAYMKTILASEAAATGDAARTLSVQAELGDLGRIDLAYYPMIVGLTRAGKPDQVEKLIAAYPGDPRDKANFYEPMLDQMIANGDVDGARDFMARHSPISGDLNLYKFDLRLLASKKIAGNRGKAEPIIRDMFKLGQQLDKGNAGGYADRFDHYYAQAAATAAFENGYTDLGIELYQGTANRNEGPLAAAFPDNMKKADMPKLLMLAQDNAPGDTLGRVVDHAIAYLQRKAAH